MGKEKKGSVVDAYFDALAKLQSGHEDGLPEMLKLWDEDGWIRYAGPPPATGEFRGQVGLRALFRGLAARGADAGSGDIERSLQGRTKTRVSRSAARGDKHIVEWSSRVESDEGDVAALSGTNTFHVRGDRIVGMEIVIAPKRGSLGAGGGFDIGELVPSDIGRLALAAWAVV